MPISIKNLFPNREKNVKTTDDIKKTNRDSLMILVLEKLAVNTAKTGIKEIGSIAIKALSKFWNKNVMHKNIYLVCSFYKFTYLKDLENLKKVFIKFFKEKDIKGTILISNEGINGSLSLKTKILMS